MSTSTQNQEVHTPILQDKSFWLALLGVLAPIVAKYVGIHLPTEQLAEIAVVVVGYTAMSKSKQARVIEAQKAADAAKAAGQKAAEAVPAVDSADIANAR